MATQAELQQESLSRAVSGQSWSNYDAIINGFAERGIPINEILPRENVFTFNAWKALGRQVRRGEHGIKIVTWVPMTKKKTPDDTDPEQIGRRPKTTTVFHVSQTDPIQQ